MQIIEYGNKGSPAVLLIHGMGCTGGKSFGSTVDLLQEKYRVILPLLDGYDGSGAIFSCIEDQARQLAAYLHAHDADALDAVLGMSMGGFIALELLLRYPVTADRLILDSGYLNPMRCPWLISCFVASCFGSLLRGRRNPMVQLAMRKVMGFCFRREDLCLTASRETIYNSERSCLTYALPSLPGALIHTKIAYWYGHKEKHMIDGMHTLRKGLPQMREVCMGNVGHGELMFTQPTVYAKRVGDAISASQKAEQPKA